MFLRMRNMMSSKILESLRKEPPYIKELAGDVIVPTSPLESIKSPSTYTESPVSQIFEFNSGSGNQNESADNVSKSVKIGSSQRNTSENKTPTQVVTEAEAKAETKLEHEIPSNPETSDNINLTQQILNADATEALTQCRKSRALEKGFWAYSVPVPQPNPELLYLSPHAFELCSYKNKKHILDINKYIIDRRESESKAKVKAKAKVGTGAVLNSAKLDHEDQLQNEVDAIQEILAGNQVFTGLYPLSYNYSGHQFGEWAGQLGDGRAMSLFNIKIDSQAHIQSRQNFGSSSNSSSSFSSSSGFIINAKADSRESGTIKNTSSSKNSSYLVDGYELALKGSGKTVFSRFGDGLAMTSSSMREFLVSEHMASLGIPTTRSLSIVTTGRTVPRNLDVEEFGAVVGRLSPSWIRFGSIQNAHVRTQLARQNQPSHDKQTTIGTGTDTDTNADVTTKAFVTQDEDDQVKQILDFVIKHHFPYLLEDNIAELPASSKTLNLYTKLYEKVTELSADLVASWMTVGFSHGVLNTDNMSILGLTIDYGPFGFMNGYEEAYICNESDYTGRYAFNQQPRIVLWNLMKLAGAMYDLIGYENSDNRDSGSKDKNINKLEEAGTGTGTGTDTNTTSDKAADRSKDADVSKIISGILTNYGKIYASKYQQTMLAKIGLLPHSPDLSSSDFSDLFLSTVEKLIEIMGKYKLDFTNTFRKLGDLVLIFGSRGGLADRDNQRSTKSHGPDVSMSIDTNDDVDSNVGVDVDIDIDTKLKDWILNLAYLSNIEPAQHSSLVSDLSKFIKESYYPQLYKIQNFGKDFEQKLDLKEPKEVGVGVIRPAKLADFSLDSSFAVETVKKMSRINPQFVLRNWVIEDIYQAASAEAEGVLERNLESALQPSNNGLQSSINPGGKSDENNIGGEGDESGKNKAVDYRKFDELFKLLTDHVYDDAEELDKLVDKNNHSLFPNAIRYSGPVPKWGLDSKCSCTS